MHQSAIHSEEPRPASKGAVTLPASSKEFPRRGEIIGTSTNDFAHSETHQAVVHSEESGAGIPNLSAFPAILF
jgi:hypothetical protein